MGIRPGEVVTLVAGTGAGKSTLCREVAMHLILNGEVVGYIALEENVRRSALGLLSILANTPLHQQPNSTIVTPELKALWKRIQARVVFYDHFGSIDSKNLLAKVRYMVKGLGVRYVVLDHLSIVVSGMDIEQDERRTIDMTMTALASMAQEMNVCLILVSHLKRTMGKPHEEGKAVTLSDLRGSHAISQLSHTVVSVERNQQSESSSDVSNLRVLKCRHTGSTGLAGTMVYERATGRLKEADISAFENEAAPGDADAFVDEGAAVAEVESKV
jgi:twinkle protein